MHSSTVKNAILGGEVIEKNAWSISIDSDDQVLIFPPKGAGFSTSLGNIDKAVSDFCKKAEMPIPGVNQSTPPKDTSTTDMGSDSGVGDGFTSPSVNKKDVPDGAKSSTDLGDDTTSDEGFTSPSVIKRQPVNVETGGLPDTDLGADSSVHEPDFHDKSVSVQEDGRVGGRKPAAFKDQLGRDWTFEEGEDDYNLLRDIDIDGYRLRLWDNGSQANTGQHQLRYAFEDPKGNMLFSGDDYGVSPMHSIDSDEAVRGLLGFLTLRPGDTDSEYFEDYTEEQMDFADADAENMSMYSMDPNAFEDEEGFEPYEFKEWGGRGASRANKIVDSFSQEKTPDFYREHKTPSASLLEDIMDPEAWAANNRDVVAQYLNESDPDRDLSEPHRQTKDVPPLVGYDDETYEDFLSDEITSRKKRSVRRQRADGFTPSKKTETKPTVSDPKVEDKTDETDRKKELDKSTGYAFADKDARKRQAGGYYDEDEGFDPVSELIESWINGNRTYVVDECRGDYELTTAVRDGLDPEAQAIFDRIMLNKQSSYKRQAGPRLREKWNNDGGYNRDMEAESAEELYHMVRSFGTEDDYDWGSYKPNMPVAPEGTEEGNASGEKFEGPEGLGSNARRKLRASVYEVIVGNLGRVYEGDDFAEAHETYKDYVNLSKQDYGRVGGEDVVFFEDSEIIDEYSGSLGVEGARRKLRAVEDKEAVDDKAKDYWKDYYGDYGSKLVDDGNMGGGPRGTKPKKKDEKKDDGPTTDTKKESRRVHAWEEWMDSAILPLCDLRNGLKLGKITCDEAIRGLEAIQNDLSSVASDVAEDLISDLRYAVNACEEDNVERVIYNINNTLENMQRTEFTNTWGSKTKKESLKHARRSIRARVKANIARRARRKAQQSQNPAVQPAGQNALEGAPLAPTSDLGGPPATGLAPTTPQAPEGKPKPEMAPGTGDSGLQALGWPPEDIQVMNEDDKQKILQIRLNKPGTQPPKPGEKPGEKPVADPTKAPPAGGQPATPAAPAATPAMPGTQPAAPAPTPVQARLMARRMDLRLRTRRAQEALEADPQAAPAAPAATPPAAPNAGPTAVPEAPERGLGMGGTDEQALAILQEVRKQEVSATDAIGVSIQKNQILAQRLMTELGISMEEARKLYGVKDTSKLFQ